MSNRNSLLLAAILFTAACTSSPQQKAQRYLTSGERLAAEGDHSRAILQFSNALRQTPGNAQLHYQLALSQLALGDGPSALKSLEKAASLDPADQEVRRKLVEVLIASGQPEMVGKAIERLNQAIASDPADIEAKSLKASAEFSLGNLAEAEATLKAVLDREPAHVQSNLTWALVLIRKKELRRAEEVLLRTAASNPNDASAAVGLARFYALMRNTAAAEKHFGEALRIDPRNASALIGLGDLLVLKGDNGRAEQVYKRLALLPERRYKVLHAAFLLRIGKTEQATASLESLYQEDKKDRDVRGRLVSAYLAAKRMDKAEEVIREALESNPRDAHALLQHSEIALRKGSTDKALSDLNTVLQYHPNWVEARYLLAQVYGQRFETEEQKQALAETLRLDREHLPARMDLAQIYLNEKAYNAALQLIDEAGAMERDTIPVLILRNRILIAAREIAEARKGIDQGLARARVPELLFQDGLVRAQQRDWRGARASLTEALERTPDDVRVLEALAGIYVLQNEKSKAVTLVRSHAAQHPQSAAIQHYAGRFLAGNGDKKGARTAFEAAKTADPRFLPADLDLARLDLEEGNSDAAAKRLGHLVAAHPGDSEAHLLLGMIEANRGNHEAAIASYRTVVGLDPDNVLALNNLAYQLAEFTPNLDEALKYAQKARQIAPDSMSEIDETIGWIYYRKGVYQSAVKYLENALQARVTPGRRYHLAMAYLRAGMEKKGRQAFEAARAMDPNAPEARKAAELFQGQ